MATGNFFGGQFFGGGYFGNVVPGPSVFYQPAVGGTSRRKKRRNTSQELFDDIEATIRQVLHGPDTTPVIIQASKPVVVERTNQFESALRELDRLSKTSRDLAIRVARLRADIDNQQRLRQQLIDEDEDEAMMVLL